jgi:hypothetical protein
MYVNIQENFGHFSVAVRLKSMEIIVYSASAEQFIAYYLLKDIKAGEYIVCTVMGVYYC